MSHRESYFSMSWGDIMDEEERLQNRTAIERVKDELADVIHFRDELRITAPDERSFQRRMDQRIVESLTYLDTYQDEAMRDDEISYWKTRGLICRESSTFANEAITALTMVVKMDPTATTFWNNLGETYCAMKNWELGRKCFLSSLEHEKNAVSLQNLSIWCRMKDKREPNDVLDGIKYAKEALKLDFSDVKSWTTLGNAYMAGFFAAQQNEKFVDKALYAYRQAEKGGPQDVEVCANKFVALKFLEHFEEALRSLSPAYTRLELDWRTRKADYENLFGYLKSIQELVSKKGKLRPKKLAEFSKRIKNIEQKGRSTSIDAPGPYGDTSDTLAGIIIFILCPDGSYPYTLGMLTGTDDVHVVTVFNLRSDKGFKIGDTIRIPAVNTVLVDFAINDSSFKFTKTRIYFPTQIELNGKRLGPMYLNPMTISSS